MSNRIALPESRLRQRRRRRRLFFVAILVVLVAALLGGLVWLSHASFLKIKTISVSGAHTLSSSTLQAFVKGKIAGSYLFVFAKDNIFLYPRAQIQQGLLASNPVLKAAEVHAQGFTALAVSVVEREPVAEFCSSDNMCYLMDEDGLIYAQEDIPAAFGFFYTTHIQASPLPIQFLTQEQFRSLSALVGALVQSRPNDTLGRVVVDEHNDVHVYFKNGFELLFTLDEAAGDTFERFTLALTAEPFVSHKLSDIAYLDLRFGDKLYYKLK